VRRCKPRSGRELVAPGDLFTAAVNGA